MVSGAKIGRIVLVFPILMGLLTLGMNQNSESTDLGRHIESLLSAQGQSPISFMYFDASGYEQSGLYPAIYSLLYNLFGISPIQYVALICVAFYFLFIKLLAAYYRDRAEDVSEKNLTALTFFALMSFSPIFLVLTRMLLSLVFLFISVLLFLRRKWGSYILSALMLFFSYFTHQGVMFFVFTILFAVPLHRLWLIRSENQKARNVVLAFLCAFLFFVGPVIFHFFSVYLLPFSNERYEEYLNSGGSAGGSVFILLMLMLGPVVYGFANLFYDKKNDFIYSIAASGILVASALFNESFFYVQRVFMLLPVVLGMISIRVFSERGYQLGGVNPYMAALYFIPIHMLGQFYVFRVDLFPWVLRLL